jgi:hypothetical protein
MNILSNIPKIIWNKKNFMRKKFCSNFQIRKYKYIIIKNKKYKQCYHSFVFIPLENGFLFLRNLISVSLVNDYTRKYLSTITGKKYIFIDVHSKGQFLFSKFGLYIFYIFPHFCFYDFAVLFLKTR